MSHAIASVLAVTSLAWASCGGDDCDLCGVTDERSVLDGTWDIDTIPDVVGLDFDEGTWTSAEGAVWALGNSTARAVVAHFDGQGWTVSEPGVRPLRAVWASAADDVWATVEIEGVGVGVWHDDGTGWMESLPVITATGRVGDILWGTGRGDPWLVVNARIVHPGATAWTNALDITPFFDDPILVTSMCAWDRDDVWLTVEVADIPKILHWDAEKWTGENRFVRLLACPRHSLWGASPVNVVAYADRYAWHLSSSQPFGARAMVVRSPGDVWILAHDEVWHFDGAYFERVIPGVGADESFVPQQIAGAPGGVVWIFARDGHLLRYTP